MKNIKIDLTIDNIKMYLKQYFDRDECVFLLASLIAGMFAHLYGIVNNINNYDSIRNNWYGDGVSSGRWFLQVLGSIMDLMNGNWDVNFFNGMLTIIMLSVTAGMIPKIFKIRNKTLSVLACILFVVYPTSTSMLFFSYTSVYYSLGIFMVIFAAYIVDKKYIGGILASIFITYATGIYQANYTIAATFILLLLIARQLNAEEFKLVDEVKVTIKYICVLLISIIHYFVMVKLTIYVSEDSLTDYQGINELGLKKIGDIPKVLVDTWLGFFKAVYGESYSNYGISLTGIVRIASFVLTFFSIIIVVKYILNSVKNIKKIMLLLLLLIYPFVVNSINFACYGKWIYTLMVYAFYASFLLPLLLLDWFINEEAFKHGGEALKRVVKVTEMLFVAVVCLNYVYQSNGNYEVAKYTDQKVTNRIILILSQVYELDGYEPDMKIIFINPYNTSQDSDIYGDSPFTYGGNGDFINSYTINYFAETYIGLNPNIVTEFMGGEENQELIGECYTDDYINAMPNYPESGSIQVYKGKVIVKFQ